MWKLLSLLMISLVALLLLVNAVWGSFPGGFAMPAIILLVVVALLVWRHLRPAPVPVVEASSAVVVVRPMRRPPFPNVSAEMVTPEKDAAAAVSEPVWTLTHLDRCVVRSSPFADRCNAQAFVRIWLPFGLDRLVCGHHADEQIDKFAATRLDVTDERGRLSGYVQKTSGTGFV